MKKCLVLFCLALTFPLQAQISDCSDLGITVDYSLSENQHICLGESINLSISSNPNTTAVWTTASNLIDSNANAIVVSPTGNTTYYIEKEEPAANIIINGDFENGFSSFSSDYVVGTGGNYGLLSHEGEFHITTNSENSHDNFSSCNDHTPGLGNMMVVNGATTLGEKVWCQTVNVSNNTNYNLRAWVCSVVEANPAALQFSINGTPIGSIFNAPSSTCQWVQFSALWNSGNNSSAELCITNQNTVAGGNDFAIDDISFIPNCLIHDSVSIEVLIPPVAVATVGPAVCLGGKVDLEASGGDSYSWTGPNGFSSTSASLSVLATTATVGWYTVEVSDTACSDLATVEVLAYPSPTINISSNSPYLPASGDGVITVSGLGGLPPYSYLWNNGSNSSTISNLNAGTYQVRVVDARGCSYTTEITLEQEHDLLGVPSAFSPNGDNQNDRFRPLGIEAEFVLQFKIYNRWGQLVYNNASFDDGGWDGNYGGAEQARDTYMYLLEYQFPHETKLKVLRGELTLLR